MVEFSIVIGVVLFLILAAIDVSRYALVQNTLTYAARSIVDKAKVNPIIGKDVRYGVGKPISLLFDQVRSRIIQEVVLDGNLPFGAKILPYKMRDEFDNRWEKYITENALLLMPGEFAYRFDNGRNYQILHPTCISCGPFVQNTVASFEVLRSQHGLYSQVAARMPILLFGNREILVLGEAIAWQEPDAGFHSGVAPETAEPTLSCRTQSREEECAKASCNPDTEECVFSENRFTPDCATCAPITCGAYWGKHEAETGETFCASIGCNDSSHCRFFDTAKILNGDVNSCGDCGRGSKCSAMTTQAEACLQLDCQINATCKFYPNRFIKDNSTQCAECISRTCSSRTTREEACAPLKCESQGKFCYFKSWEVGYSCASCIALRCTPPQGGCPVGSIWSSRPLCKCCPYRSCPDIDGRKYLFDARVCNCVLQPDDSTGDMK